MTARAPERLVASDVVLRFGGVTALDGVGFTVEPGELLGIIGPNGAGKTSIVNCLTGAYTPDSGTIELGGESLTRRGARPAQLGVARTFQELGLFANLSVVDNILLGRHVLMRTGFLAGALWWERAKREEVEHRRRVEETIELLELEQHRHSIVGMLPYGIQKRVELGRALAAEPRLLLLDEPATGMNFEETADMARYVLEYREREGPSTILVEHNMRLVMDLADRVMVLDFGERIALGTPEEVQRDERVIDAYLGAAA